jgi:hypothetical protein
MDSRAASIRLPVTIRMARPVMVGNIGICGKTGAGSASMRCGKGTGMKWGLWMNKGFLNTLYHRAHRNHKEKVSSQKIRATSRRFEWLNQFFEETFGTVCLQPRNIEKIREKFQKNSVSSVANIFPPITKNFGVSRLLTGPVAAWNLQAFLCSSFRPCCI